MLRLGIAGIGAIAGDYIGLIVGGKVRDVALTALCSQMRRTSERQHSDMAFRPPHLRIMALCSSLAR